MVSARLGVAILPRSAAGPHSAVWAITAVLLNESWARRPLMLCVRHEKQVSTAARLLIDHMTDAAAQ
jgi:DNA-binding transcriptional LysR family regulator